MPFALFLLFLAFWGIFTFMTRFATGAGVALSWEKLALGSIMIASALFCLAVVSLTAIRPGLHFLYGMLAVYILVLALVPAGLVVSDIRIMWYGEAPVIGPLYFLYLVAAYTPVVYSMVLLARHGHRTRNVDDMVRDRYLITGIVAMLIGALTDYLSALGVSMYPLGIIGNMILCIMATAAMLKCSLPEMRVLLRNGVTLLLTSLLIFGVFGSFIFLMHYLFLDFGSNFGVTVTVMVVFVAALFFQPVFSRLRNTVDRWFFRKRYDHIQTMKRFSLETRGQIDLAQLSSTLVNAVANGLQSLGVYLLLPSPVSGSYATYAFSGQKSRGRLYFPADSPLVAAARELDSVLDTLDVNVNPWFIRLAPAERRVLESNKIELLVPLKHNDNLAGLLLLSGKATLQPYSNEERRLLKIVGADVAAGIDNASLYENIKRKQSDTEKAMDGVIHAVSLVVESRDPYTAGHQRRVAELARSIANAMGLSEWQATGVYVAGLLHDVGKVAVPSEILSKSGKISQHEYNIIKSHSQVGYDILNKINFPWPVTTAILQHHERLNGSGYPAGISGREIIIEARILGVADVVEAMSSHRPYRPALGLGAALEEITAKRGVLYDPQAVDACLNLLQKNQAAFDRMMTVAAASQRHIVAETVKAAENPG